MIIDCHYHLDPRMQPVENLLAQMDAQKIDKVALMAAVCDPIEETPEYLLKLLRFLLRHRMTRSLSKALVANFDSEGNLKIPGSTVPLYQNPDNKTIADALLEYPDRFLGWIFVNPRGTTDPVEEYNKWKDVKGFIGVKAHSFWHHYPPIELLPVCEKAVSDDKPLIIHVGFGDHGDFLALTKELPDLKLILAHAGFPNYADTWQLIRPFENIHVDLSAHTYVDDKTIEKAVDALGPERCLFGSDGPFGPHGEDGVFDNGRIKNRIEGLFPDSEIRKKLLGENFARLIGL